MKGTKNKLSTNNKYDIIIHLIGNAFGGVSTVAINLMNEQVKLGICVFAVIYRQNTDFEQLVDPRIRIVYVNPKSGYGQNMLFGIGFRTIYNEIKKESVGKQICVHAHNVATIGLLSNINNIPLICTIHGVCVRGKLTLRDRISETINRMILLKLSILNKPIVAVSKATAEHYSSIKTGIKIYTVYNGVSKKEKKPILKKNSDEFWIGHIGGVTQSKGWDTVVKAFGILCEDVPGKCRCLCAGNISYDENEMNTLIKENSSKGIISILGLIPDAGNTLIPSLDALVLPSLSEGMPMCVLEAFAYGVPVIVTGVGGIPEIVIDGYNGYIVKKNEKDIAERLIYLFRHENKIREMSINAIDTYNKQLNSKAMSDNYLNIYNTIM